MPLIGLAYVSPGQPTGFVNDFANVLSAQDKQAIETKLQSLKQTTNAEVSVVTIPSIGDDETIETYTTKLFQEWGIGVKGKDNGLLILVAPNDKQARVEVGYGMEGNITDIQSGIIMRNVMIPAFKTGNYSKGISGAVDAVVAVITKSPEAARYLQDASANNSGNSSGSNLNLTPLFFIVIIFLNVFAKILGKTKSWWLGGAIGSIIGAIIGLIWGFIFVGIGSIVILTILGLIFDYFISKNPPKSGGHNGFFPMFFGGGNSRHGG
ncbi:MAG: TPM domain-containing protein, partial [Patescibacteria group bacterium]